MEDNHGEEDIGVAAHEANPAGFAFEHHEDCEVDDAGGEGCATADEAAKGDCVEGGVHVVLVGIEFCGVLGLLGGRWVG